MNLILSIIWGALAGWIAGKIMHAEGGLLRNIIIGVIGGFVGNLIFGIVGLAPNNWLGGMLVSVVGACIFIVIGRKLFKD